MTYHRNHHRKITGTPDGIRDVEVDPDGGGVMPTTSAGGPAKCALGCANAAAGRRLPLEKLGDDLKRWYPQICGFPEIGVPPNHPLKSGHVYYKL